MSADTSREAVLNLAIRFDSYLLEEAAATLRALLAERDEARTEVARLREALAGLLPTARHYGGLRDCDVDAISAARATLAGGEHD